MLRATFLAGMAARGLAPGDPFAAPEARCGGRLGVAVVATGSGRTMLHRGAERFPLASTFKLPAIMHVLAARDAGRERLDRVVRFSRGELEPPFSTIARRYPRGGALSLATLCRYAIAESDNTAIDVILRESGGPHAVTAYLRAVGVPEIRVDRQERELPDRAAPGDPRDTGTPRAMARLCADLVTSPSSLRLSRRSASLLLDWMRATTTGAARLRAGVPAGWRVADKTGSLANARNDVGLLFPPSGPPLAIACYVVDARDDAAGERAIAESARIASSLR